MGNAERKQYTPCPSQMFYSTVSRAIGRSLRRLGRHVAGQHKKKIQLKHYTNAQQWFSWTRRKDKNIDPQAVLHMRHSINVKWLYCILCVFVIVCSHIHLNFDGCCVLISYGCVSVHWVLFHRKRVYCVIVVKISGPMYFYLQILYISIVIVLETPLKYNRKNHRKSSLYYARQSTFSVWALGSACAFVYVSSCLYIYTYKYILYNIYACMCVNVCMCMCSRHVSLRESFFLFDARRIVYAG